MAAPGFPAPPLKYRVLTALGRRKFLRSSPVVASIARMGLFRQFPRPRRLLLFELVIRNRYSLHFCDSRMRHYRGKRSAFPSRDPFSSLKYYIFWSWGSVALVIRTFLLSG